MIAALLLSLALQGEAEAAWSAAQAAEPTIMVVEFTRGASYIGVPRRCPGSTSDEPDNEGDLCMAELYQGHAVVVRHLSGPRLRRPLVRVTGHALRWTSGTRILVVTRPFEDAGTRGNFALWWHPPEEDGDYCLEAEGLARNASSALARAFATGYRRHFRAFGYVEPVDFRCVHGWRRSMRDH